MYVCVILQENRAMVAVTARYADEDRAAAEKRAQEVQGR